jgi:spermidine synthase
VENLIKMILILFFLFGFYSTISQVILVREFLVIFFGNELCLGTIFFSWLLWISLGAWTFKKVYSKIINPIKIFIVCLSASVFTIPFEIFIIRNLRILLGISSYQLFPFHTMIISIFIVMCPLCFFIGFLFPLGVKIYREKNENALSRIYMFESLGSMFGGIIFTFVLVNLFNHFEILFLIGLFILVCILILVNLLVRQRICSKLFSYSLIILNLVFLFLLLSSKDINNYLIVKRWSSFASGLNLIESRDSKYQNVSIGVREDQYSVFENGHISLSFPDPYSDAIFIHPIMVQHLNPKKVLIIGIPTLDLIQEAKMHNIDEIHFVELDSEVINLVKKFLNIPEQKWIKIFYSDGRYFIKSTKEKYDIVVVNLSDPSTSLVNRYFTKEFFIEAKNILNEDGVFVTSLTSAVNYLGEDIGNYNVSIYHTLKQVFKSSLASPGDRTYFFASDSDVISLNSDILKERFLKRGIKSNYFNEDYFKTLFEKDKVEWFRNELEKYKFKFTNTDIRPVTYFFNLILWSRFTNSYLPSFLEKIFSLEVILLFILGMFLWLLLKRPSKDVKISIAITIVGLSGMLLEIILLFLFQNLRGYLYSEIGFFVSLFMFGLFLGSFSSEKVKNITVNIFIFPQVVLIVVILITSGLIYLLKSQIIVFIYLIFVFLFVITGFIIGFLFPVANKIYIHSGVKPDEASSKLDSYDHLGASIGAILGGTFLIPILGVFFSCFILIILNIFSVISLKKEVW